MSDRLAELEQRIAQLEARNAITDLATTYAVACDQHDMPLLTSLFTQDAQFTSPSGLMVADGREAIAAMFVELFKVRGPAYHWTHDVIVRFDPAVADRASGVVYSHAETTPNGVVSLAAMRYEDAYRLDAGVWRFASRRIEFLYYVPAAEYTQGLSSTARLVAGDARLTADYPEALASWQAFERQYLENQ